MAGACGITQPTAKSWLSALETSYIVFLLQPWYKNFSKRIVKTPKLYFYDTGLLCNLLKIKIPEQIVNLSLKGMLFENLMIAEYVKRINHGGDQCDIWFWRDSSGNEVDLLSDTGNTLTAYEFKAGETVMPDMFKGLIRFETISGLQNLTKILVYGGTEKQSRSVGEVMPWKDFPG